MDVYQLDEVVIVVSSLLALVIFAISAIAYSRERSKKLLIVSAAFFFYAFKGSLKVSEFFFPLEARVIDVWANLLDFVILSLFFFAMVKK